MAKARKQPVSVFGASSKKELEDISKQIMEKTAKPAAEPVHATPPPPTAPKKTIQSKVKATIAPKKKATTTKPKLKILYLPEDMHQEAKINAARRGMKLNEYASWLVSQDTEALL